MVGSGVLTLRTQLSPHSQLNWPVANLPLCYKVVEISKTKGRSDFSCSPLLSGILTVFARCNSKFKLTLAGNRTFFWKRETAFLFTTGKVKILVCPLLFSNRQLIVKEIFVTVRSVSCFWFGQHNCHSLAGESRLSQTTGIFS